MPSMGKGLSDVNRERSRFLEVEKFKNLCLNMLSYDFLQMWPKIVHFVDKYSKKQACLSKKKKKKCEFVIYRRRLFGTTAYRSDCYK